MIKNVCDMLKVLEEEGIKYAVLRGYNPISSINNSLDVDVLVSADKKEEIDSIFKKNNWYTQKLNCARYPHKQYFKILDGGIRKIDFVYGLYYSDNLYKLNDENILSRRRKIDGIYVLSLDDTIKTFLLHIFFDKNNLSKKNKIILQDLVNENKKTKKKENYYFNQAKMILNSNNIKKYIKENKDTMYKESNLTYSIVRMIINRIHNKVTNIYCLAKHKFSNKSITIIGVDGCGKSTMTESLKNILKEKCVTQYLGFKDYEISFVKKHFENKKDSFMYKINSLIYQYIDLIRRYYKYRFTHKIVIYDRFPWEAPINYKGISKLITYIQYIIFYPRPKKIYYLYCDANTSLSRKDDILDKEKFKIMKQKFDKKFLNKKRILAFSTDNLSTSEIVDKISEDLNKDFLKFLVF